MRARFQSKIRSGHACNTSLANLLQGQRDFFGAHTYERTDRPRGQFYRIDWPEPGRPQIQSKQLKDG